MKTIEPNSDSDLLHHWNTVNIEYINILRSHEGIEPSEFEAIVQGYLSLIRFLEKDIVRKKLWN